jgi:hypothetical protein
VFENIQNYFLECGVAKRTLWVGEVESQFVKGVFTLAVAELRLRPTNG